MDEESRPTADEAWRSPDQTEPPFVLEFKRRPRLIVSAALVVVFVCIIGITSLVHGRVPPAPPTPSTAAAAPAVSLGPAVVYDPHAGELLMFGGVGNDSKTWTWKGGRWVLWSTEIRPSSRFDASAVWEPSTGYAVLFGGYAQPTGARLKDLWAWNGTNWRALDYGQGLPLLVFSRLAYDDYSHFLTLLLSSHREAPLQVWLWNRSHWQLASDEGPRLNSYSTAFDPLSQGLLVTGPDMSGRVQTWLWHDEKWKQMAAASAGFNGELVVGDPRLHRVLGLSPMPGHVGSPSPTQTWVWDGIAWGLLDSGSTLPATLLVLQVAQDMEEQRLLAVVRAADNDDGQPQINEIWAFAGNGWTRVYR
jgi:hypothetical protein